MEAGASEARGGIEARQVDKNRIKERMWLHTRSSPQQKEEEGPIDTHAALKISYGAAVEEEGNVHRSHARLKETRAVRSVPRASVARRAHGIALLAVRLT